MTRPVIRPKPNPGGDKPAGKAGKPSPVGPPLIREWHSLTVADQAAEWKALVAWVVWIHDLYELDREERLPLCWVEHPGLVEELRALKAWRDFVYDQPGSSSAAHSARSWHGELRQTIAAISGFWAPVCRSGHKPAAYLTDRAPEQVERWQDASPPVMASAPPASARRTGADGMQLSHDEMREALQAGKAVQHSRASPHYVQYAEAWWIRGEDGGTWLRCTDQQHQAEIEASAARMRAADQALTQYRQQ
ncbi:hypothetical protein AB0M43_34860 [Longispora sp. NPDC051575]|uniref:hypothetical protein n=1 Tax=Longispora sp. NPDC051575 TaxID=3154943 RepID=UPI00343E0419